MTSRLSFTRTVVAALAILAGVAPPVAAQNTAIISVTVRNEVTGAPVADAAIRALPANRSCVTRGEGGCRLIVGPGQTDVRATAIGFAPATRSVSLAPGESAMIEFVLAPSAVPLDPAVTVGTRVPERTVSRSPVPVDVIAGQLLESTGLPETWQQLQRLVPSLNTPHIPLGDNHMRPITLRGLDPNHTLVLVNGKRRHPASTLLMGPAVPGRSLTDLNAIPSVAIEQIEVLRDGAGAQYGSDAIAGVVNIVLKSGEQRELQTTVGSVYSAEGGREFRDGRTFNAATVLGMVFPSGGHVTFSGEFRNRGGTNRAYPDQRPQYFDGDPRNDEPPRVSSYHGNGTVHDLTFLLNTALPLTAGVELYGMGGAANRNDVAPDAFFRRPSDMRIVRAIYPNGFLPVIASARNDLSALGGIRGSFRGWRWDLSSVWGDNRVAYTVRNSNNASLGAASPTDFYAGRVAGQQWTSNLDVSRELLVGALPVNLAAGAEVRVERFQIRSGEPDSWRDGRVPIADGPFAGRPAAAGAQGFVGYRPVDEVSPQRSNSAAYVEVETRPVQSLLLQLAGRAERYSDFGSTSDGKLAARLQLLHGLAARGSASTGFRAPALMQEYASRTVPAIRVEGGVATFLLARVFPVNTPEAQLMGATALRPERSANGSVGLVLDMPRLPVITADYYQITVRDRLGSAGSLQPDTSLIRLFDENGFRGVSGGAYFTNAWATRTRGVDIVATHALLTRRGQLLRLLGGYNHNTTRVTRVRELPPELAVIGNTLANRTSRGVLESGQPRETVSLLLNYSADRLGLNVHNQRSGPTAQLDDTDPTKDIIVRPKWITDARVSYRLRPSLELALSAANLFDVYPNELFDFKDGVAAQGPSMQGLFRYSGALSPFGINGRTVYVQLTYR